MNNLEGLSIVIPVHNEGLGIKSLANSLLSNLAQTIPNLEIILVDDGSTDESWEHLKDLSKTSQNFKCIRLCRNVGQMRAINHGVLRATQSWVAVIDGDGQNPTNALLRMWEIREKDSVIFGVKLVSSQNRFRRLITYMFYKLMSFLLKVKTLYETGEFKLLSRSVIEKIAKNSNPNSVMRFRVAKLQLKQVPIFYNLPPRAFGKSKYSLLKRLHFVLASIFTILERPKLVGVFGLLISLSAELSIISLIVTKEIWSHFYFVETLLLFIVTLVLILWIYWNYYFAVVFSRDRLLVCEEIGQRNDT